MFGCGRVRPGEKLRLVAGVGVGEQDPGGRDALEAASPGR